MEMKSEKKQKSNLFWQYVNSYICIIIGFTQFKLPEMRRELSDAVHILFCILAVVCIHAPCLCFGKEQTRTSNTGQAVTRKTTLILSALDGAVSDKLILQVLTVEV